MIHIKADGKTGRNTEVRMDGVRVSGLTKVVIHPTTRDGLLKADLTVIVDDIIFDGQLDLLHIINRRDGTERSFKKMEELYEGHDSEAVHRVGKGTGAEPGNGD